MNKYSSILLHLNLNLLIFLIMNKSSYLKKKKKKNINQNFQFLQKIQGFQNFSQKKKKVFIKFWDNYSKPTWGLARFHFTYPWFKTLHFAHLKLVSLAFRNPPLRLPLEKHIFRKKQI